MARSYEELCYQAMQIIRDLLSAGAHEGDCTNLNAPKTRCSLHMETYAQRTNAAKEFLGQYDIISPR